MLPAMHRLLLDKAGNLSPSFCRHLVTILLEDLHEKRLPFRERERHCIEKGSCIGIPASPAAALDSRAGKMPVTRLDIQISGCSAAANDLVCALGTIID